MESPDNLRMSLAAAMTLGFKNGLFYRDAKSPCINVLLTYESGCAGNCAYCGLSNKRAGEYDEKSFIRVGWPSYNLEEIKQKILEKGEKVSRICISMITNPKGAEDTEFLTKSFANELGVPVSILIAPSVLKKEHLEKFKAAGADRIGVSFDAASEELFEKFRGKGVRGPHTWANYWKRFEEGVSVFGERMVGAHLIVGLGESEEEMIQTIQHVYDKGGVTHLFSFFPENSSQMSEFRQPPIEQYRRVQLAAYLIDHALGSKDHFVFDDSGKLKSFGLPKSTLLDIIHTGLPFMTGGCPDKNGTVACNRPYSNSRPSEEIRNFPFVPEEADLVLIMKDLEEVL
jgi:biotin synthase-related radical SAM superfamily protein